MVASEVLLSAEVNCASAVLFKSFSNEQLLQRAKSLASEERQLTARLLECLSEIRLRGLHLERGYPSLFQFCMEALGFTESQAHSRISAMKLSQELPEVVDKVASGEISLTNAAAAQVFFRNENKAGKSYSIDAKRELVSQFEGLSTRQCERKLAELSPQSMPQERERPLGEGLTELRLVADAELMRDLQKLKELWSHSLSEGTYAELIKKMAKLSLEKVAAKHKEPSCNHENKKSESEKAQNQANHSPKIGAPQFEQMKRSEEGGISSSVEGSCEVEPPPLGFRFEIRRSRHIPRPIWRAVWQRDEGRCAYVDPQTGKRCESRFKVQVDHLKPFAQGGEHLLENLRLACQAHNLFRTRASADSKRAVQ